MKNNPEFDMDNENDDFDDFGGGGSRSGSSPFSSGEPDFGGEPSFEMGGEEPMGGNEPNEAPAPEPPTNEPTMTPET